MTIQEEIYTDFEIMWGDWHESITYTRDAGAATPSTSYDIDSETYTPDTAIWTLSALQIPAEHAGIVEAFGEGQIEKGDVFFLVRKATDAAEGLTVEPSDTDSFVWDSMTFKVQKWILEADDNGYVIQGRKLA